MSLKTKNINLEEEGEKQKQQVAKHEPTWQIQISMRYQLRWRWCGRRSACKGSQLIKGDSKDNDVEDKSGRVLTDGKETSRPPLHPPSGRGPTYLNKLKDDLPKIYNILKHSKVIHVCVLQFSWLNAE
jgi:hypothetical protein